MERRFPGFGADEPADLATPQDVSGIASPSGIEQRHALLIANAAYRQTSLRNPRHDIRLVGSALTQLGFRVTKVEDGDLATLRHALKAFVATLGSSDPDTVAFFYFAGHGVQVDGRNYLIPAQADIPAQSDLETRALPLEEVVAMLAASARRANILVLDACRDGAFSAGAGSRPAFSGGLASLNLPPAGMLVAFSTAAGRAANDGIGLNSPYATALVETLPRLLEPGRRVHDIFVETAEKVREATKGRQAPALFLQGGLPALTLAPEDAERRSSYDPWGPARARRVALTTSGIILAALTTAFIALVWSAMAPIDQRAWLSRVGLAEAPGVGLSCGASQTDSGLDSYGLTAADWCQLMPDDLYRAALQTDYLQAAIADGLAAGDPKAHFLRAIDAATRFPDEMADLDGSRKDDIVFDLDRAARSGLAVSAAFWEQLSRQNLLSPRRDLLVASAGTGHIPSQAMLAVVDVEHGDVATGVATLENLHSRDRTGLAAHLLALVLAGEVSPDAPVDRPTSAKLARESAQKGYLPAIDWLFDLQYQDEITLDPAETAAMMARLYAVGREEGYWWTYDRLRATGTRKDDAAALALLRKMMQIFPDGDAAYHFAGLVTRGIGGPVRPEELSAAVDQAIRAQHPFARTLRGELRMGLLKGPDHEPLLPIDPAGALADLQASWELKGDARALLLMARYHLSGVGGVRDLAAAKTALKIAMSDPAGVSAPVRNLQASVDLMERMTDNRSAADTDLGTAQAPVTVTIYFDPDCGGCSTPEAEHLGDVADWLSATYVRHGFARLELRPVVVDAGRIPSLAPLACQGPPDDAAVRWPFASSAGKLPDQTPCMDTAVLGPPNTDRLALLRSAVFSAAPVAPESLPDVEPGPFPAVRHQFLPVIVVDGWVLSSLAQEALEVTIYRLLAPAEQITARKLGAQTCSDASQARLVADLVNGPASADLPPHLIPVPPPIRLPSGLAADQGVLCAEP